MIGDSRLRLGNNRSIDDDDDLALQEYIKIQSNKLALGSKNTSSTRNLLISVGSMASVTSGFKRENSNVGMLRRENSNVGMLKRENSNMSVITRENSTLQRDSSIIVMRTKKEYEGIITQPTSPTSMGSSLMQHTLSPLAVLKKSPSKSNVTSHRMSSRFLSNMSKMASSISLSSTGDDVSDVASECMSEGQSCFMSVAGKDDENTIGDFEVKQRDLEQLNDLMSQLVVCGNPIVIIDRNAKIEYLNKEAEEVFGIHTYAISEEHLSQILVDESAYGIHSKIDNFLGTDSMEDAQTMASAGDCLPLYESLSLEEKKERRKELSKQFTLKAKSIVLKTLFIMECKIVYISKHGISQFILYLKKLPEQSQQDNSSVKLYEVITENSIMPIITINQFGIVQTFNNAAVSTFMYTKKDIIGKNVKMICPRSVRKKHDYYISKYVKTGEKKILDISRTLKGSTKLGKSIKIELRVNEIIHPETKQSMFVAFIRNVENAMTKEEHLTKIAEKIFPKNIAQRLSMGQQVIDSIDMCSLLYCDIVGFTRMSYGRSPDEIVRILHEIFTKFDDISTLHHLEKVKTIGDCYFAASGIPQQDVNHADNLVKGGMAVIKAVQQFVESSEGKYDMLQVRIGTHSCSDVIAAVVGKVKRTYDLFGSGVELCQLIEATGKPNEVHISHDCYKELQADSLKDLFTSRYQSGDQVYLEKEGTVALPQRTWITSLN